MGYFLRVSSGRQKYYSLICAEMLLERVLQIQSPSRNLFINSTYSTVLR